MDTVGQGEESAQDGSNIPPTLSADVASASDDDAMVSIATKSVVFPESFTCRAEPPHQDSSAPKSHDVSLYRHSRHIHLTPPVFGESFPQHVGVQMSSGLV